MVTISQAFFVLNNLDSIEDYWSGMGRRSLSCDLSVLKLLRIFEQEALFKIILHCVPQILWLVLPMAYGAQRRQEEPGLGRAAEQPAGLRTAWGGPLCSKEGAGG